VVKVRSYGALMGALLTISSVEAAEAATCPCAPVAPPPPSKHAAVTKAPAPAQHAARDDNGLGYAQSYYNYRSASRVTEQFVRNAPVATPAPAPVARPMVQDDGWRVAPNDAHIHFYNDQREVIVPGAAYPQSYYAPPGAYAPMAYAYPPSGYGYPPPEDASVDLDAKYFNGGVGGEAMMGGGGGGGGGGGTAFIVNNGGATDEAPNGGGENIPGGYGPSFQGVWQGPVNPKRGGLPTSNATTPSTGTVSH
jgi:hypothetical protein